MSRTRFLDVKELLIYHLRELVRTKRNDLHAGARCIVIYLFVKLIYQKHLKPRTKEVDRFDLLGCRDLIELLSEPCMCRKRISSRVTSGAVLLDQIDLHALCLSTADHIRYVRDIGRRIGLRGIVFMLIVFRGIVIDADRKKKDIAFFSIVLRCREQRRSKARRIQAAGGKISDIVGIHIHILRKVFTPAAPCSFRCIIGIRHRGISTEPDRRLCRLIRHLLDLDGA